MKCYNREYIDEFTKKRVRSSIVRNEESTDVQMMPQWLTDVTVHIQALVYKVVMPQKE